MKSIFSLILCLFLYSVGAQDLTSYKGSIKKDPTVFSYHYVGKVDSNYIVGPGDFIEIVLDNSSNPYQIGPEGTLSINGIAPIPLQNTNLKDAKALILDALQKEYANTKIDVSLFRKRKISVTVLGYVNRPSEYHIDNLSSLTEIIHMAQGFEKEADQQRLVHIRENDTTVVNTYELLKEGSFDKNLTLQDGDLIYVPKINMGDSLIYYNSNEVYYPLPLDSDKKSLYFYIDRLNFLQSGNIQSLIIRNENGTREYTNSQAKDVYPVPGDTIDTKHFYTDVFVGGMVQVKGPQKFIADARPIEYIYNAGTSVMAEQLDRIRVVRRDGSFEYIDPINGKIFPGDYIELDMSSLDYAAKWTPILSTVLGVANLVWMVYYTTVWVPNQN